MTWARLRPQQGNDLGPQPDSNLASHEQPVTWIGGQDAANTHERAGIAPERRRGRGWWVAIGVGALVAAAAVWAAMHYLSGSPAAADTGSEGAVPLVTALAPGLSPVTATVSFTGTINARYDISIGTDGETGRISAIYVEVGDRVKAGQLLAQLDETILQPQVERLAASLEEQKANSALADAEYKRAQGVESAGALSKEDIEKRRSAAVTAAAEVRVAAAQLSEYQQRLGHTSIRAPAAGVILTRSVEVGQIATPGGSNALFRLAAGSEIEMRALVAEQDLPSLAVGQAASIYMTGVEKPFKGRVRLLGAIIDPQSRLGEARIALQPDPLLRPGAFARGEVVVGKGEKPILPQTAVQSDEKGTYVLVVNANNHLERRDVHAAETTEQGIVIASGLTGQEKVVMTAGGFLRVGEQVAVAGSNAKGS
jgi:HlyD family secretion protein